MAKRKATLDIPGTIYLNKNRYWWKVKLPGEAKTKARPLRATGAKFATKDKGVAQEVALTMWQTALFNTDKKADRSDTRIAGIAKAYQEFAATYYRNAAGQATHQVYRVKWVLEYFVAEYATMEAEEFGPLALKEFRQSLIEKELSRGVINEMVATVKRMFKWAVSEQLISAVVYQGLQAVDGLKRGRSLAKEMEPVTAIAPSHVYAVLPYASEVVADMIQVQILTGMRSGELTAMRTCDIETSGRIWHYCVTDEHNKTAHYGHKRVVSIGPKAQKIVQPYMKRDLTAYMFSPKEAEAQTRAKRSEARKTPPSYGNGPGTNRKDDPTRRPGERYDTKSYRKAVTYAIKAANRARKTEAEELGKEPDLVPEWTPHQLRHTALTRARKEFGLEASSTFGGHRNMNVTEIYAEKNMALADRVAARLG